MKGRRRRRRKRKRMGRRGTQISIRLSVYWELVVVLKRTVGHACF